MQTKQTKMNKILKGFLPFVLCALLLAFYSCEYEDNETNFHHVSPPGNTEVDINLAGVNENSLIYIYAPTRFTYDLIPETRKVIEQKYYLDDVLIGGIQDSVIRITPTEYDNKEHTLRIELKVTSGTGSLAENLGLEQYISTKEFKLQYVPLTFNLDISQGVSDNGHLQIHWDDAVELGLEVENYKVYKTDWYNPEMILAATVTETFFEDKDYVYGQAQYQIVPKYKYDRVTHPGSAFYTVTTPAPSTDKIKYTINGDKMRLDLTEVTQYPAKFVVKWNSGKIYNIEQNIAEIDAPNFPTGTNGYQLYILPITKEFDIYESAFFIPCYAVYPKIQSGKVVADTLRNQIYAISLSNIYKYDAVTMECSSDTIKLDNMKNGIKSLSVFVDGRIAVYDEHYIHIYKDDKFDNLLNTIQIGNELIDHLTPIDEFSLGVITTQNVYIYNPSTGASTQKIDSLEGTSFKISYDGKYIYGVGSDYPSRLTVYDIKDNLSLIYDSGNNDFGSITDFWPDPSNSSLLVLEILNNDFTIFDVKTGTISENKTQGYFSGFDPFTGNVIYSTIQKEAVILSPSLEKEIYRMKFYSNQKDRPQLINNFLIKDNYYLNIATQLSK